MVCIHNVHSFNPDVDNNISNTNKMKDFELITDDEIKTAFGYANFGKGQTPRELINEGLVKHKAGYETGHTMQCILSELGLISKPKELTVMGEKYLKLINIKTP